MNRETVWAEEFSPMYKVPYIFCKLAEDGVIEDMSWRNDPCPSFGAKLRDKNFVRIWVEHPMKDARKGWPTRFTILVQPDLTVLFGRRILATDYLEEAYGQLLSLVRSRGIRARQGRFKVTSSGKDCC